MNHLRFALLCNDNLLEHWHLQCLDYLAGCAALVGVIQIGDAPSVSVGVPPLLLRLYGRRADNHLTTRVVTRLANVPRLDAAREPPVFEGAPLDFVLKLGRGPIPGGIDHVARYGVWCFQHESEGHGLPFLREVYDGEDVTEAALFAFGPTGDAPSVLERGWFRTEKRSYVRNRERVLESIAAWPARICRRLGAAVDGKLIQFAALDLRVPSDLPSPILLHRFWARLVWRQLSFAWQRLFRHNQWNVGVLSASVETLLVPGAYADGDIQWFPLAGRGGFLADPFGIERGGTLHVLCERFDYRSAVGDISTFDFAQHCFATELERAITLPVHMSYPFLIEDAGEVYCTPETSNVNEVALYRAIEFPHTWSKVGALLQHFRGVDPTVFRHDGRWWLTCTQKGADEDVELWVWHAAELRGPWTPHARNPVKVDVRGARPGGVPFVHDGELYRPVQDCSRMYGWRLVIQHVKRLTPTEFIEEPTVVLEPSPGIPFPLGRHTLSPVGDVVLIDGHRAVFAWPAFLGLLRIWARTLMKSR